MGELQLCLDQDYQNASYVTRYVAPGDGELINFQPGSGIAMGYDDLKVIEAHRLVQSIGPDGCRIPLPWTAWSLDDFGTGPARPPNPGGSPRWPSTSRIAIRSRR